MSVQNLNQQTPSLNSGTNNNFFVVGNRVGKLTPSVSNQNVPVLQEDAGLWVKIKEFIVEFRLRIHKIAKIPVYWGNPFKRNSVF